MAELCEDVLVPAIDEPSRPNLKGDVETFEAIALDGGGELLVPLSLPCCSSLDVGGRVPRHSELDELYLLCLSIDDDQVRFLSRHGPVGRDGDAVHPVTLEVGVDLDPPFNSQPTCVSERQGQTVIRFGLDKDNKRW